jgi:hypothetical protein
MPHGYVSVYKTGPRSILFYVVANIGPGLTTRPLAVAYRQGHDIERYHSHMKDIVDDILSLLTILSDPLNRGNLEGERARATRWYEQPQNADTQPRALAVPDAPQPPYHDNFGYRDEWKPIIRPELPRTEPPSQFPVTSACLVTGLLRGGCKSTRTGDVQLQPLSTPFYGDCLEYGMVVIDISDLENIRYGIVAFRVYYMAHVFHHNPTDYDEVEDDPPAKEPDVVLEDERPRRTFSVLEWARKHCLVGLEKDERVLQLQAYPHIDDPRVLDCKSPENCLLG